MGFALSFTKLHKNLDFQRFSWQDTSYIEVPIKQKTPQ